MVKGYIDYENLNEELQAMIGGSDTPMTFVRKVNGVEPDTEGNVQTSFQIIDVVRADVNWNNGDYPEGVSEFYSDYDKSNYQEYIENNPSFDLLQNGMIAVRTFIDTINSHAIQTIDNVENGVYDASYVRVGNSDGTWGELRCSSATQGGQLVLSKPTINSYYYHPAESEGQLQTITIRVPDYNPETDVFDYYIRGFHMPPRDVRVDSYENEMLTVTILEEGRYVQFGSRLEVVKWRYGTTPRLDATVIDSLDSDSRVDAVSAYQANFLKNTLSNTITGINNHITKEAEVNEFGHVKLVNTLIHDTEDGSALDARQGKVLNDNVNSHVEKLATVDELGHVKVDGTTIIVDNAGKISAVGGGSTPLSDDILMEESTVGASTKLTKTLLDLTSTELDRVKNDIEDLNIKSTEVASVNQLGHVKVDGITITADSEGVITAVGGGSSTPLSDQWNLNDSSIGASTKATYELEQSIQTAISTVESNLEETNNTLTDEIGKIVTLEGKVTTNTNEITELETNLTSHTQTVASTTTLGHVKVDGTTIRVNNGVISSSSPVKATATQALEGIDDNTYMTPLKVMSSINTNSLLRKSRILTINDNLGTLDEAGIYEATGSVQGIPQGATTPAIVVIMNAGIDESTVLQYFIPRQTSGDTPSTMYFRTRLKGNVSGTWVQTLTSNLIGSLSNLNTTVKTTIVDAINEINTRSLNTLADVNSHKTKIASATELGHVKVNNEDALVINTEGTIGVRRATDSSYGTVSLSNSPSDVGQAKVTTPTYVNGVITNHSNSVASSTNLGHIKVDGSLTTMDVNGVLNVRTANSANLGVVKLANEINNFSTDTAVTSSAVHAAINSHNEKIATNDAVGHVKPDGTTITVNENGELSAVNSGTGNPLSDDFTLNDNTVGASTKATNELHNVLMSAVNGIDTQIQTINQNVTNLEDEVELNSDTIATNQQLLETLELEVDSTVADLTTHKNLVATTSQLGHVKVDGTTINVEEGNISIHQDFQDTVNNVAGVLITHEVRVASEYNLGHVKVDGSTITADLDGVIKATGTTTFNNSIIPTTPFADIPAGINIGNYFASTATPEKTAWLDLINTTYGWNCASNTTGVEVETIKGGNEVVQRVRIHSRPSGIPTFNDGILIGEMYRRYMGGAWNAWFKEAVVSYGDVEPPTVYGIYGARYIHRPTGNEWIVNNPSTNTPRTNAWVKKVANYKLKTTYRVVDAVENQNNFALDLTNVDYSRATIEIYDSGILLLPEVDYQIIYDNVIESLTVTLLNPKPFVNKYYVKIIEVKSL